MALSDLDRGRAQRGRHRRRARHPEAALRRALPDRPGDPRAARAHDDLHPDAGAGRRRLARNDGGGAGDRARLRRASRAGHRLRRRHLARGPCQCAGRRHLARHVAHEPRARGQSRGSRLHRRARRDARGSQPLSARHRPVLPDRSRRQCQPRRHGGDAGLGHQRRALRHDARQRAVADRGDGRRQRRSRPASAPRRARPATI